MNMVQKTILIVNSGWSKNLYWARRISVSTSGVKWCTNCFTEGVYIARSWTAGNRQTEYV